MNQELKDLTTEINTTFNALKEELSKHDAEVRKTGEASAETREMVDKINDAITELRKKYDEVVVMAKRPTFEGANNHQTNDPEIELRKSAFVKMLRYGHSDAQFTVEEKRALSGTSDADGGFFVPATFENVVIKNAYDEAELRPLCQVGSTGRDTVVLPKLAKPAVAWGTKGVAVSAQELGTGVERLEVFPLRALVLMPNDTLDDAEADIWTELQDMFSGAIAEAEDDAFIAGSGAGEPGGVLSDPRVQALARNSGVAGALSDGSNNGVDVLMDAMANLKKRYRRNATWAFNSITEGEIRKLKGTDGHYLWQGPASAGAPATLLGRPIANPEGAPDIVAGAFPIVFGDFRSGYKVRDRAGMSVQRLTEKYAEFDQTGMIIKRRTSGQVVLPEAFVPVKIST